MDTQKLTSLKQTQLAITNQSTKSVLFFITLGATKGCVNNVSNIPFVTTMINKLQGSFTLGTGKSVRYTPPSGVGVNGVITVGTPPLNCAVPNFPNGVNVAEFILNNAFQGKFAQESLDISGVAGTNAAFKFSMTGGGPWNDGTSNNNITSFHNKAIGQNIGLVGVFPYLCDICTASKAPPKCSGSGIPVNAPNPVVPQNSAICLVQRDPKTAGGTVTISFNGFL
ncbi:MAG: hypothetical protein K0U54_11690 [Bacteroidetes bacterium]|nr:hypothetical protein [Bacteroidota bacterium]